MSAKQSTYSIVAHFRGSNRIIDEFRKIQGEARKTGRVLSEEEKRRQREQERLDRQRQTQARQRERQAEREAMRAVREAENAQRRVFREQQRLRQEDLARHRQYVSQLRKQESDLREERSRAMRRSAIGIAGLVGVGAGIRTSANFEAAMTDLRLSIQRLGKDGRIDIARLNQEMREFETLSIRLGNELPGTTEDFVQLFAELRKGGIDTKIILGGAGEAVANLAVLLKQQPRELGDPFAQMGQMLSLRAEDYVKAADLFSRLYRSVGLKPEQLIESAKYAVPRALAPLGLQGFEGLTTTAELMGLLKRRGIEGSMAGTQVSMLMGRLTFHRKTQTGVIGDLRRQGINLDFFDKKGNFAGIENFLAQMEKLRVLSQEKRLEVFTRLFGEEAKGAAQAFMETGVQGYQQFQAELRSIPPLQSQINELQGDFNAKLEAMLGTGENVIVRVFTPLMNTTKPALDLLNQVFSSLEGFSREHPGVSKFATSLIGMGSAYLLVSGGIGAARRSLALWRLTGKLAAAENIVLSATMQGVGTQALTTSAQVQTAGTKVAFYKRQLTGIPAMIGTTIVLTLGTEVIAYTLRLRQEAKQAWEDAKGVATQGKEASEKLQAASPQKFVEVQRAQVPALLANLLKNPDVISEVRDTSYIDPRGGYRKVQGRSVGQGRPTPELINAIKSFAPELSMPAVLGLFMERLKESRNLTEGQRDILGRAVESAFPESFKQYIEALAKANQDGKVAIDSLAQAGQRAAQEMQKAADAASDFAAKAGKLGVTQPEAQVPGMALGGIVTRPVITGIGERGPEAVIPLNKLNSIVRQYGDVTITVPIQVAGDATPGIIPRIQQAVRDEIVNSDLIDRLLDQRMNERALGF